MRVWWVARGAKGSGSASERRERAQRSPPPSSTQAVKSIQVARDKRELFIPGPSFDLAFTPDSNCLRNMPLNVQQFHGTPLCSVRAPTPIVVLLQSNTR